MVILTMFYSYKFSLINPRLLLIGRKFSKYAYKWLFYQDFNLNLIFCKKPFIYSYFTQFYLVPQLPVLKRINIKLNILKFKRQVSFLKKRDNVRRLLLFRANSRFLPTKSIVNIINPFLKNRNIGFSNKFAPYLDLKKALTYSFKTANKFVKHSNRPKTVNVKNRFNRVFFENRKILTTISNYRSLRQKHFTNLFSSFLKKNFLKTFFAFELNIINILLKSRFFFSKKQAQQALHNNIVFVNGVYANEKLFLKTGDRIQLIVNPSYYYIHKVSVLYSAKFQRKVSQHIWRLVRFTSNIYKQAATHVPRWVFSIVNKKMDIPYYLEVDFLVLTSVMLTTPFWVRDFSFFLKKFLNFNLLRLYNWRYIV